MVQIERLKDLTSARLDRLFNRYGEDFSEIMFRTVIPIVNDVRKEGDAAVRKYTEKYDGVRLDSLLVTGEEIERAWENTPHKVMDAFRRAKENIEEFHLHQKPQDLHYTRGDGTILGVRHHAIEGAAIYVPGGKASYPSTVLMGAVPAKIAGTKNITIITPPGRDGAVSDAVLAVCRLLDLRTVLKSGGAQGVAAAGIGTETVKKSDIIVGPGNMYVTAAKSYLFSLGIVQIDSMAGPSEVLIIADESANPLWVAYDLLSQAEHEESAVTLLVTPSEKLAHAVRDELTKDIESGRGRQEIKRKALQRGLILIVDDLDEAVEFSNRFGPEHLELMVPEPMRYLPKIQNAGSLFLGGYSPVAVGDYYSGTNHILPTGGSARFSSGVGVETFLRRTPFQLFTPEALRAARGPIGIMSRIEGFGDKHGGSVDIRFE
jgi:histidinol dehydrogenase